MVYHSITVKRRENKTIYSIEITDRTFIRSQRNKLAVAQQHVMIHMLLEQVIICIAQQFDYIGL
jgi:hypothetical protein